MEPLFVILSLIFNAAISHLAAIIQEGRKNQNKTKYFYTRGQLCAVSY